MTMQGSQYPDPGQPARDEHTPEASGSPYPPQLYPEPTSAGKSKAPWVVAGVLAAALVVMGVLLTQKGDVEGDQAAQPTVTETATSAPNAPPEEAPQPAQPPAVTVTQRVEVAAEAPRAQLDEVPPRTYWRIASKSSNTSTSFAENVSVAYNNSGLNGTPGSLYDIYSPATGLTYSMRCTGGSAPTCMGGNNARVTLGK